MPLLWLMFSPAAAKWIEWRPWLHTNARRMGRNLAVTRMKPQPLGRIPLIAGLAGLTGVFLNQLFTDEWTPEVLRSEALAALMGVVLLLVAVLWSRVAPEAPERVVLDGEQGLRLEDGLDPALCVDLAWGSQMLLTATPAAVVLLIWDGRVLLHRGLIAPVSTFAPGPICEQARQRGRAIALVNLALYPGRAEFETLLPGLPSVVIEPLQKRGWLVVGGWAPRCFNRSDETWIRGLGERFTARLLELDGPASVRAAEF